MGDYSVPIAVAVVTVVAAALVYAGLKVLERNLRSRADSAGVSFALATATALDGPVTLLILVWGLSEAASEAAGIWQADRDFAFDVAGAASTVGSVAVILIGAYILNQLLRSVLVQTHDTLRARSRAPFHGQWLRVARRMTPILVYSVAGLLVLAAFDIAITPFITTLGIGGIAIALAVQPTLANYLAGTYVISEGEIGVGDFIEIEGGPSGFVEEISWRSTKLRSRFNNLTIIPNSLLAEKVITNYSRPVQAINVRILGGVSYSENLVKVEEVLLESARTIVAESEVSVKDFEPVMGFNEFGDSNIGFWVFAQAMDRAGSFQLQTELIKDIHRRFKDAGIVINYPMRHLVWDGDGPPPEALMAGVMAPSRASDADEQS